MATRSKPAVLELLSGHANLAADDALLAVLGEVEEGLCAEVLDILLARNRSQALLQLVIRYADWPPSVQTLIVENVGCLDGAIRHAIAGESRQARTGAIELIRRSRCGRLAYLLTGTLRADCGQTRQAAACALSEMAEAVVHRQQRLLEEGDPAGLELQTDYLVAALADAVGLWERHTRFEVLNAALWFGERMEPAIRRKLAAPRTHFALALGRALATGTDPRLAPFTLCAVGIDAVASAAVQAIEGARRDEFVRALLDSTWLLADRSIRRGLARVRKLAWLREDGGPVVASRRAACAVRFVSATGVPREAKLTWYQSLLTSSEEPVRRAVIWQLVADSSRASTTLLVRLANDGDDELSPIARREIERRKPELGSVSWNQHGQTSLSVPHAWGEFWDRYDDLAPGERESGVASIRQAGTDLLVPLRAKLASSQPLDRARALRIIHNLGFEPDLTEQIYHLAHDGDPVVRATAVSMLAALPGATSERILRTAVEDRDERVQANAVETLDAIDAEHCHSMVAPKLESSHPRVRANAIKALLRLEVREAGEALIEMLEDPSSAARLSALWVVQRLELRSIIHRLIQISESDPNAKVRRRAGRIVREMGL